MHFVMCKLNWRDHKIIDVQQRLSCIHSCEFYQFVEGVTSECEYVGLYFASMSPLLTHVETH